MKGLRSLNVRLLVGAALWTGGLLLCAVVVERTRLRGHLEAQYRERLASHLDELEADLARDASSRVTLTRPLSDRRFGIPLSGLYWEVRDSARTVLASPSLAGGSFEPSPSLLVMSRWITTPAPLRLIAVAERRLVEQGEAFLQPSVVAMTLVLAALLLGAGAVAVRGGLRSFAVLRERLAAVRGGAARRLEGSYPSEVQPLVDDLNGLLQHNEKSIVRATQQSANLAHALKTPLAVIANEAFRLTQASDANAGQSIGRQVRLMEDRVDVYLARARVAASGQGLGARSEAAAAIDGVVRVMRRLHGDRPIVIDTHLSCGSFRGEQHDLEEILGNLLDNACKWASTRVVVACVRQGDHVVLSVDDDGPGIDADRRGVALALDDAAPRSGYGLVIVRDLVDAYGGTVQLAESLLGGLRVVVTLPAAGS